MNDIVNINDYNSINILNPKKIYSFTTILLIIFIVLSIILSINFDFNFSTKATYIKENDTLKIIVDEDDLDKITNNNRLIIDLKEYEYKVRKIDKKILDSIPLQQYNEITISLKLDDKYKVENNSINLKVKYDQKKGFKIIKDFILGEGK